MVKQSALSPRTKRLPNEYVALDLETTGLSAHKDAITEIGAVKIIDGEIIDRYSQLVNPQVLITPRITQITGIDNAMVEDQPVLEDVLDDFVDFLEDYSLVGHNIQFDMGFLREAEQRTYGLTQHFMRPTMDTMIIDRHLFPTERHRLVDLIRRYGIADVEEHRALSDATQTYQCLEWQRRFIACDSAALPRV